MMGARVIPAPATALSSAAKAPARSVIAAAQVSTRADFIEFPVVGCQNFFRIAEGEHANGARLKRFAKSATWSTSSVGSRESPWQAPISHFFGVLAVRRHAEAPQRLPARDGLARSLASSSNLSFITFRLFWFHWFSVSPVLPRARERKDCTRANPLHL